MLSIPDGMTPVPDFDEARLLRGQAERLRGVVRAAEGLHERFAARAAVVALRTLPLTTLPYPTKYALQGAAGSLSPFVRLTHRATLVQFLQGGTLKTLLFNPTDIEAARATPYFSEIARRFGALEPLLQKRFPTLEAQLASLGLGAGDIDYVAFDHFHTQDLRGQLGTDDGLHHARFPNATLLAPKTEWDDWQDVHPMQRAWFIKDGRRGVRTDRVALTDADLLLGEGVMLVRTPGHTVGNQTLFINTGLGVWGISENGTCADNWTPRDSAIRGVAATARAQDLDVLLNANTPERGGDQYTSMMLEKTLVSRVKAAPTFVQMFPSSEITAGLLMPLRPTWVHRTIAMGTVSKPTATPSGPNAEVSAPGA